MLFLRSKAIACLGVALRESRKSTDKACPEFIEGVRMAREEDAGEGIGQAPDIA